MEKMSVHVRNLGFSYVGVVKNEKKEVLYEKRGKSGYELKKELKEMVAKGAIKK